MNIITATRSELVAELKALKKSGQLDKSFKLNQKTEIMREKIMELRGVNVKEGKKAARKVKKERKEQRRQQSKKIFNSVITELGISLLIEVADCVSSSQTQSRSHKGKPVEYDYEGIFHPRAIQSSK